MLSGTKAEALFRPTKLVAEIMMRKTAPRLRFVFDDETVIVQCDVRSEGLFDDVQKSGCRRHPCQ